MYAAFVGPGDLVFDVGAHLGDRTVAFAGLGAQVIALEPQPALLPVLRRVTRRYPGVAIQASAVGAVAGTAELLLSPANPTVSSLSRDFVASIGQRNAGFRGVRWTDRVTVPVTTLDALIAEYGLPAFCKVDVEGYEEEVLAGLSQPLPALSVEFLHGALRVAAQCVRRLEQLGTYRYNAVAGEGRRFLFRDWQSADAITAWLAAGETPPSGDIYAWSPSGRRRPAL